MALTSRVPQLISRRLPFAAATTRHIHASVLLAPNIQHADTGMSFAGGVASGYADALLQAAENKARARIAEAHQSQSVRIRPDVSKTTSRHAFLALAGYKKLLLSEDHEVQLFSAREIRKLLSEEGAAPLQEVIDAELVHPLVSKLVPTVHHELQLEAAWALTNIASGTGEQAREVIRAGAVPLLVQLMRSPDNSVREQAVWALGNIAGDSAELRDLVISSGALQQITEILHETKSPSLMQTASWLLTNFCQGKPTPTLEMLQPAIPLLKKLLQSQEDDIVEKACWACACLIGASEEHLAAVMELGVCQQLVDLLMHPARGVQIPALSAVGNIAAATDAHTEMVVKCGVLPALAELVPHSNETLCKGALWVLSNIVVGRPGQIKEVVVQGLVPTMICHLQFGSLSVKKEAAWAIGNMIRSGEQEHIKHLVACEAIKPMVDLLGVCDHATSVSLLAAIERIVSVGQDVQQGSELPVNPYVTMLLAASSRQKLESLSSDANPLVRELTGKILASC